MYNTIMTIIFMNNLPALCCPIHTHILSNYHITNIPQRLSFLRMSQKVFIFRDLFTIEMLVTYARGTLSSANLTLWQS